MLWKLLEKPHRFGTHPKKWGKAFHNFVILRCIKKLVLAVKLDTNFRFYKIFNWSTAGSTSIHSGYKKSRKNTWNLARKASKLCKKVSLIHKKSVPNVQKACKKRVIFDTEACSRWKQTALKVRFVLQKVSFVAQKGKINKENTCLVALKAYKFLLGKRANMICFRKPINLYFSFTYFHEKIHILKKAYFLAILSCT